MSYRLVAVQFSNIQIRLLDNVDYAGALVIVRHTITFTIWTIRSTGNVDMYAKAQGTVSFKIYDEGISDSYIRLFD